MKTNRQETIQNKSIAKKVKATLNGETIHYSCTTCNKYIFSMRPTYVLGIATERSVSLCEDCNQNTKLKLFMPGVK